MTSLLELRESNIAVETASYYSDVIDRKEIYIKQLILDALNKQSFYVNVEDSLFYSNKFYSKTKIFDFYVNNNLFDLIVLKPDSEQMLFEVKKDDIHANIFGYVVARITSDLKNVEILGYFEERAFSSVVTWNMVDAAKLKPVENFANISIMDTPIEIDDVSDRFFGLLSSFMDGAIDETDFSELACLLYNSNELRGIFNEFGRFDKICSGFKDNSDIIDSLYDGKNTVVRDDSYISVPKDISVVTPPVVAPVVEPVIDIPTIEPLAETPVIDDILVAEPTDIVEKESQSGENLVTEDVIVEPVEEVEQATEIDNVILEQPEETIDLQTESGVLEEPLDLSDDVAPVVEENIVEDVSNIAPVIPAESEDVLDDTELDELEEFNFEIVEDEPIEENIEPENQSVGASEGVSLKDKLDLTLENDTEVIAAPVEELQPTDTHAFVDELQTTQLTDNTAISETQPVPVDDEIMKILDDVEDDVRVDNNEIMSILNSDEATSKATASVDKGEYRETKVTIPIPPTTGTEERDITMLFNGSADVSDSAKALKHKGKLTKTQKQIAAIVALVVLLGGVYVCNNFSINPANITSSDQDVTAEDYEFPQEPDKSETNVPNVDTAPIAEEPSYSDGTQLVTSRTRETGAAPVILKSVAWQVPTSMSHDAVFSKYLQIAGKNIKLNLASDLLGADDFAYNNRIKVSMTVKNNAAVRNIRITESSGSKNVDEVVLQSVKLTLKYINTPVMSTDVGDRDVVLVISI